jgi:hypothetical protein
MISFLYNPICDLQFKVNENFNSTETADYKVQNYINELQPIFDILINYISCIINVTYYSNKYIPFLSIYI